MSDDWDDNCQADDERDDDPRYAPIDTIEGWEIPRALTSLALFDRDPYLRMQAYNLAIVDSFINELEQRVMHRLMYEDRTPVDDAMFLSAQSQMWIFAAYEMLRTWRQRTNDTVKLHRNGGLNLKIASLEKDEGFEHFGKRLRADILKEVQSKPDLIQCMEDDLKRTHQMFTRLEFLRVSLAKHEVSGKAKAIATAPGYGRINGWCGSLDYELGNGKLHYGLYQ